MPQVHDTSVRRIIAVNYHAHSLVYAFIAITIGITVTGIVTAFILHRESPFPLNSANTIDLISITLYLELLNLLVCMLPVLWQVIRWKGILKNNFEVTGLILEIDSRYFRDELRVRYSYSVDGAELTTTCPLRKTPSTLGLNAQQETLVLVHEKDARRSLLKAIFL